MTWIPSGAVRLAADGELFPFDVLFFFLSFTMFGYSGLYSFTARRRGNGFIRGLWDWCRILHLPSPTNDEREDSSPCREG